jgi:hypothetical protein
VAARTLYKYFEYSLKDFPSKKPHSLYGVFHRASVWGSSNGRPTEDKSSGKQAKGWNWELHRT